MIGGAIIRFVLALIALTGLTAAGGSQMATLTVQPGQSIQAAVDAASAGDTILVEPGVYAANIQVTKPDLTLRSTVKWGAIIDGGGAVANGIRASGSGDRLTVDGFEIRNVRSQGSSSNGVELYSAGAGSKVLNCHIHHVGQFNFIGSNGQTGVTVRQDGVTVEGNYFHHIGRTTPGDVSRDHGIYANGGGDGADLTIRGNYFEDHKAGWGIQLYPGSWTGLVVEGNKFVGGNPSRDGTHIVLGASLSGRFTGNLFWHDGPSETLHDYSGPWAIDMVDNISTGDKWSDDGTTGLNFVSGNVLNAQLARPPAPTAGAPPPPPPPPPPVLAPPVLAVGEVTNSTVTLTWPRLTGVSSYRFFKDGVQVATGGNARTSWKSSGLPPSAVVLGVEAVYANGAALASKRTLRVVE